MNGHFDHLRLGRRNMDNIELNTGALVNETKLFFFKAIIELM